MNKDQDQPIKIKSSDNHNLFPLIIISAIVLGFYGVHDFLMKRFVFGFIHLFSMLIAYIITTITGNLLPLIIVIPASYIIGLVEAFVYGQDYNGKKIQVTTDANNNANKNSGVQFSDNTEEARIANEKAILDKQLKEGKIDGVEYNKRIIELTIPEEPKPATKKSSKLAGILWILSFLNAVMVVYYLYEGSKSVSDGALPEALAMVFFAPLTAILVITATIVTAHSAKKR